VDAARARTVAPITIGHFGTYGEHIGGELARIIPALLTRVPDARLLLAGRGAAGFAGSLGALRSRLDVVETDDAVDIAAALRACDMLVQPYPDGVTTRRTSMMAALAAGVPVITTRGELTEPVWPDANAVAMVAAGDPEGFANCAAGLAADVQARRDLGARGRRLYDEQFALDVTVARIRR
jgi:glycosyltransferase involved in cell wall biosynthesis